MAQDSQAAGSHFRNSYGKGPRAATACRGYLNLLRFPPAGWWFGTCVFLIFFHILGILSSQLTQSYFTEWSAQPPTSYSIHLIPIKSPFSYCLNHSFFLGVPMVFHHFPMNSHGFPSFSYEFPWVFHHFQVHRHRVSVSRSSSALVVSILALICLPEKVRSGEELRVFGGRC